MSEQLPVEPDGQPESYVRDPEIARYMAERTGPSKEKIAAAKTFGLGEEALQEFGASDEEVDSWESEIKTKREHVNRVIIDALKVPESIIDVEDILRDTESRNMLYNKIYYIDRSLDEGGLKDKVFELGGVKKRLVIFRDISDGNGKQKLRIEDVK